ncbi:MAG: hypothetical protein ACK5WC_03110 [Aphanizomenon sp.]|jgi:hypothetical protein|uniref:Uncharacterized protein n=1 Tax=Aphanizomenon flos-aquae LD13 TaxID=1710894 RepID=A0A1B7VNY7_APHFL|nr:hypothetical protein [Aphanizomenon flos-aquae UKL13-PB]OBQ22088.1 MAG: hypothetical protein AN481_15915 [Aphanizomenon flos-aquae LD13]OBQ27742.1 MAG: hypothetical protein AN483_19125 [Aphanizomenon flos-aquae MDT14a]HCQ22424.1 hypothetical protein [Anabaena sp. UBA12330]
MQVFKRAIKPESYISFLHTYQTTWGTAGDICLVRESIAKSSGSKFLGRRIQLALPKGMERDHLVNIPIIKIAGHVGDGHPKDPQSEWEAYEGIDPEIALTVLKIWGFKLIEL